MTVSDPLNEYMCEECGLKLGKAGTLSFVRNYFDYEGVTGIKHRYSGPTHCFCPEHYRESKCLGVIASIYNLTTPHENTYPPECPYCGTKDYDYLDSIPSNAEDGTKWNSCCGFCDRDYVVTVSISMSFSTEVPV